MKFNCGINDPRALRVIGGRPRRCEPCKGSVRFPRGTIGSRPHFSSQRQKNMTEGNYDEILDES